MATGNYPGRARTPQEARQDYEQVLQLVPGTLRLNIHALYAETKGKAVDRDALEPKHFANWMDWGKAQQYPPRLQSLILLPPEGKCRLHPCQHEQGNPEVLDPTCHRLAEDRGAPWLRNRADHASSITGYQTVRGKTLWQIDGLTGRY
jgi:hypothetical protein